MIIMKKLQFSHIMITKSIRTAKIHYRLIFYFSSICLISIILFFLWQWKNNQLFGNREILKAIVQVIHTDKTGTAFFIRPNYLLTAAHVAGAKGNEVQLLISQKKIKAKVILSEYDKLKNYMDEKGIYENGIAYDWALLKVIDDYKSPYYLKLGDSKKASSSDPVIVAGYPKGIKDIATPGGNVAFIDRQLIKINQKLDPGYSGSPLLQGNTLKENCQVIGIISANIIDSAFVSMGGVAVTIDTVLEQSKKKGTPLKK